MPCEVHNNTSRGDFIPSSAVSLATATRHRSLSAPSFIAAGSHLVAYARPSGSAPAVLRAGLTILQRARKSGGIVQC